MPGWSITPFRLTAPAYSIYWQPPPILKSFNFVTSSCSPSPTVKQGTSFSFPGPSIVNTFPRRTAFFPNKEIFAIRPNKLTRCIFKTTILNKSRIDNNANIYKRIHEIRENNFKATNQKCILKSCDTHAHTSSWYPGEEWGNLPEGFAGDRKLGMSLNIFAESEWNDGNRKNNDVRLTGAFGKPANPPISFVISVRSSVYMYRRGFHWSTLREIWYSSLL